MRFSRISFKVAGCRKHDVIILFVNDFVNSFGARMVAKCSQLDDFVNSFGGGSVFVSDPEVTQIVTFVVVTDSNIS